MIRDQIDESIQNNANFPQLPSSQTILFILSFLEHWLPVFCTAYISSQNSSHLEDEISEELFFFLEAKAKLTDLLIRFDAKKGVDFLIRVHPPIINSKTIFVIEAKRLSKRHYDYVHNKYVPKYKSTGGIERFKREHDGFDQYLAISAMLGYVQENTFTDWHYKINTWIESLIEQDDISDDIHWEQQDLLKEFSPSTSQMARYTSTHSRKTQMNIKLHHFWLNMHSN